MENKNALPTAKDLAKVAVSKEIHTIANRKKVVVKFILPLVKEHADIELNLLERFSSVSNRVEKNFSKFKNDEKRPEVKVVSLSGDPSTSEAIERLKKDSSKPANIYQGINVILDNPSFFSNKKLVVMGSPFKCTFSDGNEIDDLLYICIEMSEDENKTRILSMKDACQANWDSSEYEFLVVKL